MNNLQVLEQTVFGCENQFNAVVGSNPLKFAKEAEFAMQALGKSEYAIGIALGNKQSVIDAVVNVGAIGLSLNPALREAYLIPRKPAIVLDISYIGYAKLATDSGSVQWLQAHNAYESDTLVFNGIDKEPTFIRDPFKTDRGAYKGTFCVAKLANGDYLTHVMSAKEILDIKARSQSVKAGKQSPWDTDAGEMCKKTCIKQFVKMLPRTEKLAAAIEYSNKNGEGVVFEETKPVPSAKKIVTPENSALWDRAKTAFKRDGNLNAVTSNAVMTDEYQTQLIAEVQAENAAPAVTYMQIMVDIDNSATVDQVNDAQSLIASIASKPQQAELQQAALAKIDELEAAHVA